MAICRAHYVNILESEVLEAVARWSVIGKVVNLIPHFSCSSKVLLRYNSMISSYNITKATGLRSKLLDMVSTIFVDKMSSTFLVEFILLLFFSVFFPVRTGTFVTCFFQ